MDNENANTKTKTVIIVDDPLSFAKLKTNPEIMKALRRTNAPFEFFRLDAPTPERPEGIIMVSNPKIIKALEKRLARKVKRSQLVQRNA